MSVVAELWVVFDVVAAADPVVTPTDGQVARIRGLGPTEHDVVVARGEADLRVKKAVGLRVPLDLWIGARDARRHSDETREIGRAEKGEIGAVVHADHLVHHLDVAGRPDGAGAVGRRRSSSLGLSR